MLTLLKIRNLALVDELAWELGPGLISVTGETGAGKSVIVGGMGSWDGVRCRISTFSSVFPLFMRLASSPKLFGQTLHRSGMPHFQPFGPPSVADRSPQR